MTPDFLPDDPPGMPDWLTDDSAPPDLAALLGLDDAPPPAAPAEPVAPPAAAEPFVYGTVLRVPADATGVVRVEHDVPAGISVIGTKPGGARSSGRTLTWELAPVPPGGVIPIRIKAELDGTGPVAGCDAPFRVSYVGRSATAVPVFTPAAEVALTGPEQVESGDTAAFALHVRNTGNCPLTGLVATLSAEGGLAPVQSEVALPDLAPGAVIEATIPAAAGASGDAILRVTVTADPACTTTADARCRVTAAQLVLSFTGPDAWRVNQTHALTATVRNAGTADARFVGMRVTVPAGWDVSPGSVSFDHSTRTLFAHADQLSPGAALAIPLTVRPTAPGSATFRAEVEDDRGTVAAEYAATAVIDAADTEGLLERFVREVGYAPGEEPVAPRDIAPGGFGERAGRRLHPHVVFTVADTEYALPLGAVREVARPPRVTPVPGGPDWLTGVANVRGDVVSVVDLGAFLGEAPGVAGADRRLLVVASPGGELTAGLLVDRVRGIQSLPPAEVRDPAAPLAIRSAPYMTGVAAAGRRPLVVLAPDRLLLAPEFLPFGPG